MAQGNMWSQNGGDSSGGININGIIRQYEIAAGENISAGDFVTFINQKSNISTISAAKAFNFNALKINDNLIFLAYENSNSSSLYGIMIKIENNVNITKGTPTQISTASDSAENMAIEKRSDNEIILIHTRSTNGTQIQFINFTDNLEISIKLSKNLQSVSKVVDCLRLKKINENSFFYTYYMYSGSSAQIYGSILTINVDDTWQIASYIALGYDMPDTEDEYNFYIENNMIYSIANYSSSKEIMLRVWKINEDMTLTSSSYSTVDKYTALGDTIHNSFIFGILQNYILFFYRLGSNNKIGIYDIKNKSYTNQTLISLDEKIMFVDKIENNIYIYTLKGETNYTINLYKFSIEGNSPNIVLEEKIEFIYDSGSLDKLQSLPIANNFCLIIWANLTNKLYSISTLNLDKECKQILIIDEQINGIANDSGTAGQQIGVWVPKV